MLNIKSNVNKLNMMSVPKKVSEEEKEMEPEKLKELFHNFDEMLNESKSYFDESYLKNRNLIYHSKNNENDNDLKVQFNLIQNPIYSNKLHKFKIIRIKSNPLSSQYQMQSELTDEFIMNAKQVFKLNRSYFLITCIKDQFQKERGYIGKVRAKNWDNTQFAIQSPGFKYKDTASKDQKNNLREEHAYVDIAKNNENRIVKVLIPKRTNSFVPTKSNETLKFKQTNNDLKNLNVLISRVPVYNLDNNEFGLNFYGRANEQSIKNTQLKIANNDDNEEKIVLMIGKEFECNQNLDFSYPLSPFQAFGIAIAIFNS